MEGEGGGCYLEQAAFSSMICRLEVRVSQRPQSKKWFGWHLGEAETDWGMPGLRVTAVVCEGAGNVRPNSTAPTEAAARASAASPAALRAAA